MLPVRLIALSELTSVRPDAFGYRYGSTWHPHSRVLTPASPFVTEVAVAAFGPSEAPQLPMELPSALSVMPRKTCDLAITPAPLRRSQNTMLSPTRRSPLLSLLTRSRDAITRRTPFSTRTISCRSIGYSTTRPEETTCRRPSETRASQ